MWVRARGPRAPRRVEMASSMLTRRARTWARRCSRIPRLRVADWLDRAEPAQPFGRLIRPSDLAGLATYLLSDAAEMMTGALIDFDQNVMGAYT